ncbi:MAG TPA: MBL fold metallo-hydrolase [Candidatus Dormibacteraeota bacterium]|nr:MBL fold metallo-hydrolase [Candidatus Dormibacteraeota bacterium]
MKLTVIGCWGGYPAPGEATSAYLIEKDDFNLLIDVGSGALSKLQQYKHVMDVDAVIVSHYHADHIADIGVLQYAWLTQSYLKDVDEILPIYGHMDDEFGFSKLTHDFTEGIPYDPNTTLEIGPFSISFLKTKHPVPCYGMRISDGEKNIVYTADTSYQNSWIEFSKEADLLIADCNFYADQDGSGAGHMTSEEGGKIAKEAEVKDLLLSHLPQYGNREQLIEEASHYYKGKIRLAKTGLVWGE